MDVTLVEHAQNDVYGNQRGQNQNWLARKRRLECGRGSLETRADGGGEIDGMLRFVDGFRCLAERYVRSEIE